MVKIGYKAQRGRGEHVAFTVKVADARLEPAAATAVASDPLQAATAADLLYVRGNAPGFRRVERSSKVIYLDTREGAGHGGPPARWSACWKRR